MSHLARWIKLTWAGVCTVVKDCIIFHWLDRPHIPSLFVKYYALGLILGFVIVSMLLNAL